MLTLLRGATGAERACWARTTLLDESMTSRSKGYPSKRTSNLRKSNRSIWSVGNVASRFLPLFYFFPDVD